MTEEEKQENLRLLRKIKVLEDWILAEGADPLPLYDQHEMFINNV